MLNFEQLIDKPPLKTCNFTLDDGRDVTLHELPLSVIEDVQYVGQQEDDNVGSIMKSIVCVVAHSLLGRPPEPDELKQLRERFGASAMMAIYYEALKFSRLGPDDLDETKKP
ncbi:hypothetical protein NX722_05620 [Endozoicomonas gorgoniicola]|uniref:Phage tail assembly protein n=1 Tax=Endozoicomonas gorgoniicola TaxID=1234144 RepID=A0ABT3MRX9_9GAMM|nr:hypothetical protein [Endozoicomonas gorgoniicola]MCW7552131.1 hypothetical protein [Endozoicomonas gorgoniicola]